MFNKAIFKQIVSKMIISFKTKSSKKGLENRAAKKLRFMFKYLKDKNIFLKL